MVKFQVRIVKLFFIMLISVGAVSNFTYASKQSAGPETELFNQAITLDLSGNPLAARRLYNILEQTYPHDVPSVPSAINYYALNEDVKAKNSFTLIRKFSDNSNDREYASLWLALLHAKLHGAVPRTVLNADAFITPSRIRMARLYSGEIPINEFIERINTGSTLAQRDEFTETVFFTVAYLKYVMRNTEQAESIVRSNKNKLYSHSLERPLLEMGKP